MAEYRRNRVAGGVYFFTVALRDRRSRLLISEIERLRDAVRSVRLQAPFRIDAWVVMPDHLHCVWSLPPGDADYSRRWHAIKARFSRSQPKLETRSAVNIQRGERGIWQLRYWEHTIRDERDFAAHVDHTHFNPVKHGLVRTPGEWPYSTFHRCVTRGMYPADWADGAQCEIEAGERDETE